ncbi:MAG: hypothetical protein IT371_19545 [Deltaproteobacteria bacterium]|nr:hypothetical protein [Deltaproteobacteria bacterium]
MRRGALPPGRTVCRFSAHRARAPLALPLLLCAALPACVRGGFAAESFSGQMADGSLGLTDGALPGGTDGLRTPGDGDGARPDGPGSDGLISRADRGGARDSKTSVGEGGASIADRGASSADRGATAPDQRLLAVDLGLQPADAKIPSFDVGTLPNPFGQITGTLSLKTSGLLTCSGAADKDCKGELFVGVYSRAFPPFDTLSLLAGRSLPYADLSGGQTVPFTLSKVPAGYPVYLWAFLKESGPIGTSTDPSVGDPVTSTQTPAIPIAGSSINVVLQLRSRWFAP